VSLEVYLNKGVKEIITEFPEIEQILDEYEIGCGTCGEGLCLLKDVVEIHDVDEDVEIELMARISNTLFPDEKLEIPKRKRKSQGKKVIRYSPPMKKMVDEHVLIKRWLALIPKVIENLDLETEEGLQLINNCIDFIRNYADKFHHAKEEDEAFKYFDENLDMIQVIRKDHIKVRAHVKAMLEAIKDKDKNILAENLKSYAEILPEHIKKEDEILFPWMDRNLSTQQVGKLYSKFSEIEENFGLKAEKHKVFIETLESKFC
jgi:hemerythrin-like domain-containing protein